MARNLLTIFFLMANSSFATEFAVTMDDPNLYDTPVMSPTERDKKILSQLNDMHIQAALFVCGQRIDSAQGKSLLSRVIRAI